MAPYVPEEVDVFTVPHSRMMELVNDYFDLMKTTNFSNSVDLEMLLESLTQTFAEFKIHEQIENKLIMKRLRNKLKRLSIKNAAVCNCHKDNRMTDIVKLLKDGYTKKTDQDLQNFETQLKAALDDFTSTFIPHMREEEEVFQPLLLEYFTYEELRDLKQKVIRQHLVKTEGADTGLEKHAWDDVKEHESSSTSESEEEESKENADQLVLCNEPVQQPSLSFNDLPPEICFNIFSHLTPQDLSRASQVNKDWNDLAYDPGLWRNVLPVQWANGDLSFHDNRRDDDYEADEIREKLISEYMPVDDDADIDESEVVDNGHELILYAVQKEALVLNALTKYILPRVGKGVHTLILSDSKALTNSMLSKMLIQTPNLEHLDLTQTRISDSGLKNFGKNRCGSRLKSLVLSGCVNISNATLIRLAMALGKHRNMLEENDCLCEEFYRATHRKIGDCLVSYCRKTKTKRDITSEDSSLSSGTEKVNEQRNKAPKVDKNSSGTHKNGTRLGRPSVRDGNINFEAAVGDIEDSLSALCLKNPPLGGTGDVGAVPSSGKDLVTFHTDPIDNGACHVACEGENLSPETEVVLENCDEFIDSSAFELCAHSGKLCRNASTCCLSKKHKPQRDPGVPERPLEYLNLSGCFQITDSGLRALWGIGRFPNLRYLDLSGCFHVTAGGLEDIAPACPNLDHAQLYYCDNIEGGPFADTASGCQNLECGRRVCCRNGH